LAALVKRSDDPRNLGNEESIVWLLSTSGGVRGQSDNEGKEETQMQKSALLAEEVSLCQEVGSARKESTRWAS
jgi:hypothetical protein